MLNFASLAVLLCSIFFALAQECKHIRKRILFQFETKVEAERRAVFERCLVSCNESPRGPNPCYNCILPYKGFGCLLRREELIGCETDCALQSDEDEFMRCLQRCAQKRRTLKKLREFKAVREEMRPSQQL
ncbi:hypothetical protein ANCCAN_17676 [Ancylostoma caninum]|uniref:Uncharacterized protein n=1 Tax=Ancylostoma caninum TaxID=29170 RepID=A0A368FY87_ANCCA|nr:hypothetical protein ANCCAN_17676 [Ancylostoma caninum]